MSSLFSKPQALLFALAALSPTLLPTSAHAQFALAPGTYELANGAQGTASLKFVPAEADHPTLVTGVRNGQERSFRCAEVAAFTVDSHKFSRQDGFRLRAGYDAQHPGPVLLELAETGPVELFYYHYVAEMGASLKAHVRLPVLRKQGTQTFFVYSPQRTPGLPTGQGNGTFAAVLFSADPVLQRRFATNAVTRTDIAGLIHAYNSGVRLKL